MKRISRKLTALSIAGLFLSVVPLETFAGKDELKFPTGEKMIGSEEAPSSPVVSRKFSGFFSSARRYLPLLVVGGIVLPFAVPFGLKRLNNYLLLRDIQHYSDSVHSEFHPDKMVEAFSSVSESWGVSEEHRTRYFLELIQIYAHNTSRAEASRIKGNDLISMMDLLAKKGVRSSNLASYAQLFLSMNLPYEEKLKLVTYFMDKAQGLPASQKIELPSQDVRGQIYSEVLRWIKSVEVTDRDRMRFLFRYAQSDPRFETALTLELLRQIDRDGPRTDYDFTNAHSTSFNFSSKKMYEVMQALKSEIQEHPDVIQTKKAEVTYLLEPSQWDQVITLPEQPNEASAHLAASRSCIEMLSKLLKTPYTIGETK